MLYLVNSLSILDVSQHKLFLFSLISSSEMLIHRTVHRMISTTIHTMVHTITTVDTVNLEINRKC